MTTRKLSDQEYHILNFLVAHSDISNKVGIAEWLKTCECESLSDGNMGSIRLSNPKVSYGLEKFSRTSVEAEFLDADGIMVTVALNVSERGYPLEIDIWKVNFESLIALPSPNDLKLKF